MVTALQHLNELERLERLKQCGDDPYKIKMFGMLFTRHSDKTAGDLCKAVTRWIELQNGFSTRMSVEGRVIEGQEIKKGFYGVTRTKSKRIPSSNLKGSADTTGCFLSVRLEVEIKIGSDTMKPDQIKFKERIESADGFYMVVKSFDDFYNQWDKFIRGLPEHFMKMHKKSLEFIEHYDLLIKNK